MPFLRTLTFTSFSLAFAVWALPVWAAENFIDVLEIDELAENPVISHENILPGDSFSDPITVQNLTAATAFDIAMNLDIDGSQGFWNFADKKIEQLITIQIQRDDLSFVTLPGPGDDAVATLQELDGTTILLGSVAGGSTEVFTVLSSFDINAGNEYQNTKVYFNLDIGVEIVGETPQLLLTKSNDSVGDEAPGNEVVYTLQVTAVGGDVNDVTVTDLPPEGFDYVGGSGEGAPFVHEYASPGIWDLGDMKAGETKTLTYRTKISSAQDAGLYRDLAFARGTSDGGVTVLGNGEANPFVGTAVNVALNTTPTVVLEEDTKKVKERKTKTITQAVLGATLPLTGTKVWMVGLALLFIAGGATLVFLARRHKQRIATLFILVGMLGVSPLGAEAATLSAKIETPAGTMRTQNFKIGFATLDVLGRNLAVECYTTLAATPFATYALESAFGGNAGDCQVNSSVVPTDGNYEFFIRVKATGSSPETVESEHVTVTVAADVPGTPTNYDRNDDNCQATLSFTTADDGGKTVKVEVYRSTENPFVANASTKVLEQSIGSNTAGSLVTSLPDCNEDIFYALRAVAANGNGSGFVGDVEVHTETDTVTRTRIKTVTIPSSASGAIPVTSASSPGAVQGVATETPSTESTEGVGSQGEGEVLGARDEQREDRSANWWETIKQHPWWSLLGLVFLLLLARYGYRRYSSRRKPQV